MRGAAAYAPPPIAGFSPARYLNSPSAALLIGRRARPEYHKSKSPRQSVRLCPHTSPQFAPPPPHAHPPTSPLRETFAGYPAFLAPGSRKKPDPVALMSISVGNRGSSTDPAARWSGPNSKHQSKPPERAPTIAAGQKIQDLGQSVARRALHVRRSSAPQCVAQIAGAWAAFPPPDAHS